ncbi:MAG: hypothetical protein K940chlam5_01039 [Candidatus Anoxychlamydiales bacterium]|nr:hypothetical protein [Candidatus Anoxychlamydiales bacterium]
MSDEEKDEENPTSKESDSPKESPYKFSGIKAQEFKDMDDTE